MQTLGKWGAIALAAVLMTGIIALAVGNWLMKVPFESSWETRSDMAEQRGKVRDAEHSLEVARLIYAEKMIGEKYELFKTCILILLTGGGVAGLMYAWRTTSILTVVAGRITFPVHRKLITGAAWLQLSRQVVEAEQIYNHFPEEALTHTEGLAHTMAAAIRGARGNVISNTNIEQGALTAAPLTIPPFRDVLQALEPGDQMYLGTDNETQEAVRGTFEDLYSSFFAGETGSGKSSWLRGIIAQSLTCYPGVKYHILDPHGNRPDSLTASLPKSDTFVILDRFNPLPGFFKLNQLLQTRLDVTEEITFPPLVFVVDELNFCSKEKYAKELLKLCDRISTEGRKVDVFLLVSSQDTRQKKGLDFRDCLASSYVFLMKSKQASYLLQDPDDTAKHKQVTQRGEALLNMTTGKSRLVTVPFCSPADMRELTEIRQVNGPSIVQQSPLPMDSEMDSDGLPKPGEWTDMDLIAYVHKTFKTSKEFCLKYKIDPSQYSRKARSGKLTNTMRAAITKDRDRPQLKLVT